MTATVIDTHAAPARRPTYGSMSRDRRWALRWSYFFLILFAIFFLLPPKQFGRRHAARVTTR